MRRPFGPDSHAVGATISFDGPHAVDRDEWMLGDLVLWAQDRVHGSESWLLADVAEAFVGDWLDLEDVDYSFDWRSEDLSDWRERGWESAP